MFPRAARIVSAVPPPRHPLQDERLGEQVVVIGAGEQGEIAYEYLTHDSPHDVVGFAVEARYKDSDTFCGRPLVAFEAVTSHFGPDRHPGSTQDRTDGLTVDLGSWWFNLRPSNTEPLLRLNLEAPTAEECQAHTSELTSLIRELS